LPPDRTPATAPMSRLVPLLCAACVAAIGLTAWSQLAASDATVTIPTVGSDPSTPTATAASERLRKARMHCTVAAFDTLIDTLQKQVAPHGDKQQWHQLAESYLERASQRAHLFGMAPGEATFAGLPEEFAEDLEAGLAAVAKARELGDDSGQLFRIEA